MNLLEQRAEKALAALEDALSKLNHLSPMTLTLQDLIDAKLAIGEGREWLQGQNDAQLTVHCPYEACGHESVDGGRYCVRHIFWFQSLCAVRDCPNERAKRGQDLCADHLAEWMVDDIINLKEWLARRPQKKEAL